MQRIISTGLKISPLGLLTYAFCSNTKDTSDANSSGLVNFQGFKNR